MDAKLVSSAKPAIAGAISSATIGTELPTDATTKLNEAFKNLGYISDDGLTNEDTRETEELKAWGGDVVDISQTGKSDKFKYTLIEVLNVDVLKEVYGPDNVTGDLASGIKIEVNSKELPDHPLVVDMLLKNGAKKRIVIPNAKVLEVGEITYADNDLVGYETTIQALPDSKGNTHYEYIKGASESTGTSSPSSS
ncbi:TPA: phage tail protein [Streptococcus suis]|nr:phage tail protein [Streptococcus suis]HEL2708756.1 phage tail protein [Streptococcus suis]HEM2624621.1 phage tail protein [Streptococcus suis]